MKQHLSQVDQRSRSYSPRAQSSRVNLPNWPHIWMGVYGFSWALTFDVGVRLYAAEIVAILGLLSVSWFPMLKLYPVVRTFIGIFALWAVATIASDIINQTDLFDSLRTVATPVLALVSLLFCLAVMSRNPLSLLTFLASIAFAKGLLGEPAYGDTFGELALSIDSINRDTNFFKVRISPFLTPLILLVGCLVGRKSLLFASGLFIVTAVGYFSIDARSNGLMFFCSAIILTAIHTRFRPTLGKSILFAFIGSILASGAYVVYIDFVLTNNPSGQTGKQIAYLTNPYNPFALLLQGRSEWLVMVDAIIQRPFFGWGSWAADPGYYFSYLRADRTGAFDYENIARNGGGLHIPAHSVIGAAWMWSGLLGFITMIWLLRNVVILALKLSYVRSVLLPAAVFLLMQFVWDFFFSPPQSMRLFSHISIASLIMLAATVTYQDSKKLGEVRNTRFGLGKKLRA